MPLPLAGDVLRVTRAASAQFDRPVLFRVIRALSDWPAYVGWWWLDGYQLDQSGVVERRQLFVRPEGLQQVRPTGGQ